MKEIEKIFEDFLKLNENELKKSSLYKFREEILRFHFYKSLLENNIECENIEYEADFEGEKNNKVDLKFENNNINNYIEFKFDTLNLKHSKQEKEKNNRPRTMRISNSIFDLFKLKYGKEILENSNANFYFIYCCDFQMKGYIKTLKNLNFLKEKKLSLKDYKEKFEKYLKNEKYKKDSVEFEILKEKELKDGFGKKLNFYLFEIK